MGPLDWGVLLLFLGYTVWDGIRLNKHTGSVEDLLLAKRSLSWWAIGISVLATQASAITFIGTTGQAYMHDMRFVQIYLATPIAMVILCVTLLPMYVKTRAYTAYELLETRFGLNTRLATSFLFLLSRGLAMGITIAAPAYVLALILELPLTPTILIIGVSATVYTMFGGIGGVIRTDIKQMALMLFGLGFCFFWILYRLPAQVDMGDALTLAGALGKLETIDFSFDPSEKYNIWSGLIAGLFLMLAYFGSDQSQVQRYLTAKNLSHARASLILPAIVKIPMQFFILLLGVYLYVFYLFAGHPVVFTPDTNATTQIEEVETHFQAVHAERQAAAFAYLENPTDKATKTAFLQADTKAKILREEAIIQLEARSGKTHNDTNYVLPFFILKEMPTGILGLIIAAIFAAALSSIDSILNSLTASSIMDWYQRLHKEKRSNRHYLHASRWTTLLWGALATLAAIGFGETESIVELINRIGSYFYGPIFGVFVLLWVKKATGRGAILGLCAGILVVFLINLLHTSVGEGDFALFYETPKGYERCLEYLWLNPIGVLVTVGVGVLKK